MNANTARRLAGIPLLLVFLAALTISWQGLTALAVASGISAAWLLPIVVDGTTLAGGLAVIVATDKQMSTRFGWFLMLAGCGVSVAGNVLASSVTGHVAGITHSLSPIFLALTTEAWLRTTRHAIVVEHAAEEAAEKAAQRVLRAQERASKPKAVVSASTQNKAVIEARSGSLTTQKMDELRNTIAAHDGTSVTARARALLAVAPNLNGREVGEVLGLATVTAGYKAKERALRVRAA